MYKMKKLLLFLFIINLSCAVQAQHQSRQSLHGEWLFALDPVEVGESGRWYATEFPRQRWDKVTVPHCFSIDPRYQLYTGSAWYVRNFTQAPPPKGFKAFLRF